MAPLLWGMGAQETEIPGNLVVVLGKKAGFTARAELREYVRATIRTGGTRP